MNFYILIFKEILLKIINAKNYLIFLIIIIATIFILIICYIVTKIEGFDESRIFNIRTVPKEYRVSLLNEYIDKKYIKDEMLFLGDSQPNGYLYPEKDIFPTILSKKLNKNSLNLAYTDSRILDNIYILKYMKSKSMQLDTIIYNVNMAHFRINNYKEQKLDTSNPKKNYKFWLFLNLKSFLNLAYTPTYKDRPIFNKSEMVVPNDYLDMTTTTIDYYKNNLADLIKLSKSISKRTIIYITPYSNERLKKYSSHSIEGINNLSIEINKVCKENNIQCLEPNVSKDLYFFDIVHLNLEGHQKMADEFYQFIIQE